MAVTVAKMTKEELGQLIEDVVENKLLEILGDPDEGLEIKNDIQERLLRQKKAVELGERGESLENVVRDLGLK
jgi:hypothetical protein